MARELAQIRDEALENPFRYYHLNGARAESLEVRLEDDSQDTSMSTRLRYIRELVHAGEIEAAIRELEQFIADVGAEARTVTSQSKPLYELLAIAHLRKGELHNCVLDHATGSCILPLTQDAVHADQEGSRRAIAIYERILDAFPDDLTSRWLLNVAYMTVGAYPSGVPERYRIGGLDRDASARLERFTNVAPSLGVDVRGLAGGVVTDDFDGDGLVDILVTAYGLDEQVRLFLADGAGGFVDNTGAAGLVGVVSGLNAVHADYDNDGDIDVLILRGGWLGEHGAHPNSLLRNNGDGTFEDVTVRSGLGGRHPTQTAAWADFNNDGWLDLFVGNEAGAGGGMGAAPGRGMPRSHPSNLFLNDGDPDGTGRAPTFTDVAGQVGIDVDAFVKGVVWGDVNNDRLPDLYVSILGQPNRLYVNRGGTSMDDWRFEEVAGPAGVLGTPYTFPALFFDYDNDGWQDLLVPTFDPTVMSRSAGTVAAQHLGLPARGARGHLYRNDGNPDGPPTFTDVAPEAGLDLSLWAMGINYGDINNDGYPDVYVGTGAPDFRSLMPNRMFLNDGGTRFVDVTYDGGFGHLQKGHGIAFADFDRDGDQDIYAVMGGAYEGDYFQNALFENPNTGDNNWVVLELEGRTANRSAIGARMRLRVVDPDGTHRNIHVTVTAGGSFGASSLQQEIGLGPADRIDEVRISWPNREGTVDVLSGLAVNRYYQIVEGRSSAEDVTKHILPFRKGEAARSHRKAVASRPR